MESKYIKCVRKTAENLASWKGDCYRVKEVFLNTIHSFWLHV